eukprot:CAMPEP_0180442726 /NCGR_PEP_ID=MMETSP1036_2-20121128/14291_1 /TAXON_ID=632150 /ORGANISM="Azadinium spinosum, Strain 3D9" /LENGTH=95 /DNA_ID=CAMNT_0022448983 /DNA_START=180 /DNA_END=467 /DNA_ORIENTATION=-
MRQHSPTGKPGISSSINARLFIKTDGSCASLNAAKSERKNSIAWSSVTSALLSRISTTRLLSEAASTQTSWWSGTSRNSLASAKERGKSQVMAPP